MANANFEDGLPTSLTREISYLNTLKQHDNVNRLIEVEIFKNNTVSLIFEHQPFNLKDILKQWGNMWENNNDKNLGMIVIIRSLA